MMQDGVFMGFGYPHIFMGLVAALVVAALVKYVFFR